MKENNNQGQLKEIQQLKQEIDALKLLCEQKTAENESLSKRLNALERMHKPKKTASNDFVPGYDDVISLVESKQKAESYLNVAAEIIVSLNREGNITLLNDSGHKLLGYKPGELIGKNWFKTCLPEENHPKVLKLFKKLLQGETSDVISGEGQVITKSNARKTVYWYNRVLKDPNGNIAGTLSSGKDISEQKHLEQLLELTKERYRIISETTSDFAFSCIKGGKGYEMDWMAGAVERITGYSVDDIKAKKCWRFMVHPDDDSLFVKHLLSLKPGEESECELRIYDQKGTVKWLSVNTICLWDEKKEQHNIYGGCEDITGHKYNETALLRTQKTVDKSPLSVFWISLEGKFIYVNETAAKKLQYAREELLSMYVWDVDPNYPRETREEQFNLHRESGGRIIESEHKRSDGTVFPVKINAHVLTFEGQEMEVAEVEDITGRKQAEEALRVSEARFKSIIAVSNTGAWEFHYDKNYLWCSPEYFTMLGRDPADYKMDGSANLSEAWVDLLHPNDRDRASKHFADYLAAGSTGMYENYFRMQHQDGSWVWIWSRGQTLRDRNDMLTQRTVGTHIDISELKRKEENLIKSEERYRNLVDTINSGVAVYKVINDGISGSDYIIQDFNQFALKHENLKKDQVLGKSLKDIRPNIDDYGLIEVFRKVWKTGESTFFPAKVYVDEKYSNYYENTVFKLPSGEIVAVYDDVTNREIAEKTKQTLFQIANEILLNFKLEDFIRAIEKQLSQIIDTTNFYIALYDSESGMLSAPFEKDEKDSIESWPAKGSATGLVIEEKQPVLLNKQDVLNLIESGKIKQTGSICESWLGVPILVDDKAIGAIIVQSYDNTDAFDENSIEILLYISNQISLALERIRVFDDMVQAKNNAEESEEKYRKLSENLRQERILLRTIIDSIPDAIYLKDMENRKVLSNKADCINLGVEKEEDVIGKTDADFFSAEIAEKLLNADKKVLEEGISVVNIEECLTRPGMEKKWLLTSKLPLRNDKGKIVGLVGIGRDITERKQAELELIATKEKALESDRLKSAFLANMSHEIRTPMNGILGFAELLKEPQLTDEQQQQYIEIIQKSGDRMLNIINDIVDISRIEAGLMDVALNESDINEQLDFIYTFFKPQVEAKGMKLILADLLPAEAANTVTDREKLYAVLTNMVKNAIKYSHEGTIEFGCKIVETHGHASLQFYVRDTGIGIPKDRQQAIFERFIQADIEDIEARQGAGLGLAISKAYVEMLGGEIWVESEEGKGSTFYFSIPYKKEHQEADQEKTSLS